MLNFLKNINQQNENIALNNPKWITAMNKELESIENNQTQKLVNIISRKKGNGCEMDVK